MKKRLVFFICAVLLFGLFPVTARAAGNLEVKTVEFTAISGDNYKVSWKISGGTGNMNVTVFLSQSDHDYKAETVELGSIRSGSEGSLSVQLPDVDSGYYHFMIGVTTMRGTITYAFSKEAFFYDNTSGASALTGVIIGRNGSKVYGAWNEDVPAVLSVYDQDTKELLLREHSYEKPLSAEIPAGHSGIIAGIAAFDGTGGRFEPVVCEAEGTLSAEELFPETGIVNQTELQITPPEGAASCRVFLNGTECDAQSGAFRLELREGDNSMTAFVTDENGGTSVAEKEMILDTVPPELLVESPGATVTTSKNRVFIQGTAEKDAFVTCDNEAVAMVGNCFSIEKEIGYGSHSMMLSATDKAGNSTSFKIEVHRSFWTDSLKRLVLIAVLAAAGILAEMYLVIWRQRRRKTK